MNESITIELRSTLFITHVHIGMDKNLPNPFPIRPEFKQQTRTNPRYILQPDADARRCKSCQTQYQHQIPIS